MHSQSRVAIQSASATAAAGYGMRGISSMLCGVMLIAVPILIHDPFSALRPYSAHDYYRRGENYLAKSLPTLAAKDFDKAIERDPYDPAPYVALSRMELEQGLAERALSRLLKAIWLNPENIDALTLRAKAYEALNQPERARADQQRVRELALRSMDGTAQSPDALPVYAR